MSRLRCLTAGESHGPALVAVLEGMPAGVPVSRAGIDAELARRRLGHGRSPRMAFEEDRLEVLGGVRHGYTLGSPVALVVHNTEWPKWAEAMSPDAVAADAAPTSDAARGRRLTRPRPGHADLVGALKYGYDDVRDALERASARETAARVAIGAVVKSLLAEVGVTVVSHVVAIGDERTDASTVPGPADLPAIDASPVRCADEAAAQRMVARIDRAVAQRETLGGVIEVVAHGLPPGLGSHVHWDRRLDMRLGAACLSVPAMKGVELGRAFEVAALDGSAAHDEITYHDGGFDRTSNRAGGLEAGMTTGQPLVVRVAMKPLSSLTRPLRTVDIDTKEPAEAITQRSDTCSVPRAGVVLEAVIALEIADALLEKTGGDTLDEVRRNLDGYLTAVAAR